MDIKVYQYYNSTPDKFYRAECNGFSVSGNTIKIAISDLLKELKEYKMLN